jgi:hypothetical protein
MTDRLVVLGGLDLEARREFIATASGISLERASDRLRADLDAAGVSHFFD